LLSYGASLDRPLGIPGEELGSVVSARSFVHFYNGHPHAPHFSSLDLSKTERVTIIGQGNVALDCARILLSPIDALRKTDISERALAELARSRVRTVEVVGRRGPLQIACTTKELREMMALPGVGFTMDQDQLQQAKELVSHTDMSAGRMKKRLLGLMEDGVKKGNAAGNDKEWHLRFLRSPVSLLGSTGDKDNVERVRWEVNSLTGEGDPVSRLSRGTGEFVETETDLVLKSVGYRSIGIPGVPFDSRRGVVSNVDGRVVADDGVPVRIVCLIHVGPLDLTQGLF
jgi:adrenodoxin-NADP+ reductase